MDNGDVIPNLDAPWDFLSTRIQEWIIGAIVGLIVNELFFTNKGVTHSFHKCLWISGGKPVNYTVNKRLFPILWKI